MKRQTKVWIFDDVYSWAFFSHRREGFAITRYGICFEKKHRTKFFRVVHCETGIQINGYFKSFKQAKEWQNELIRQSNLDKKRFYLNYLKTPNEF